MFKHAFTVALAVLIAAVLLLYLFVFQVGETDVVVLMTFSNPQPGQLSTGLHFKWPWPIQSVQKFDRRLQTKDGRLEEKVTKDNYNYISSYMVGWKVNDPIAFQKNFGKYKEPMAQAWPNLERIVRNRMGAVLGNYNLGDLVNAAKEPQYAEIQSEIRSSSNNDLEPYGIELAMFKITRFELPESVTKSVYKWMIAERTREAERITNEANTEANRIKEKAKAEASQIKAVAETKAERIRAEADADAAKYYGAFTQNPELAIFLREIRALKETLKSNATIIIGTETPPFHLLKGRPSITTVPGAKTGEVQEQ